MGMDVWVNVFRMPFLCADSGPWREMSRAWPPMSAITTSSVSACPSHQESAWRAAEARQERVIVAVVKKDIVVVKCWRMRWTHLQMFSVSTVLGQKASDVEKSWEAGAKLAESRPPPHWTGRGQLNEGIMFGELRCFFRHFFFFFFYFFLEECEWLDGNGCVSECLQNPIFVRRLWTVEKDV